MSEERAPRAAELLRRAFDDAFAAAPAAVEDAAPLLQVMVEGAGLALPLADVTAVIGERVVVPLPGAPPDLVGLASFRGDLVAVHALGVLLGRSVAPRRTWTVLLVGGAAPVGLAVDALRGRLHAPPAALTRDRDGGSASLLLTGVASVDGAPISIVDVPAVVAMLRARSTDRARGEEFPG